MAFTDDQLERYSRHLILKEIGVRGQKKLLAARVLVIGAGDGGVIRELARYPEISGGRRRRHDRHRR